MVDSKQSVKYERVFGHYFMGNVSLLKKTGGLDYLETHGKTEWNKKPKEDTEHDHGFLYPQKIQNYLISEIKKRSAMFSAFEQAKAAYHRAQTFHRAISVSSLDAKSVTTTYTSPHEIKRYQLPEDMIYRALTINVSVSHAMMDDGSLSVQDWIHDAVIDGVAQMIDEASVSGKPNSLPSIASYALNTPSSAYVSSLIKMRLDTSILHDESWFWVMNLPTYHELLARDLNDRLYLKPPVSPRYSSTDEVKMLKIPVIFNHWSSDMNESGASVILYDAQTFAIDIAEISLLRINDQENSSNDYIVQVIIGMMPTNPQRVRILRMSTLETETLDGRYVLCYYRHLSSRGEVLEVFNGDAQPSSQLMRDTIQTAYDDRRHHILTTADHPDNVVVSNLSWEDDTAATFTINTLRGEMWTHKLKICLYEDRMTSGLQYISGDSADFIGDNPLSN